MQRFWKYTLAIIFIFVFMIMIFWKILPIFSKPNVIIQNQKFKNDIYTIEGKLNNGNFVQVFDREITLDSNNNFIFELTAYKNNYIIIKSSNKWHNNNTQTFYLKNDQ